ncbi:hypothetical protein E2C01_075595 [Portunus trituberculatus]|uniref:Uncharacterized protein n=1 Tax=Portunus trituberculatus TaxID=210409 RepID=A0A5B7IFG1_PORTR|nr:hypothetical protein [Portunus trituberculatus]
MVVVVVVLMEDLMVVLVVVVGSGRRDKRAVDNWWSTTKVDTESAEGNTKEEKGKGGVRDNGKLVMGYKKI